MKLLADENLSRRVVNAFRRHSSAIQIVRVQEVGLLGRDDTAVLNWAAENDYVLITKDRASIPPLVAHRLETGIPTPYILIIGPGVQLNELLVTIEAIVTFELDTNWQYPIRWIP
jgi:predicted nuclease of predicted toxin-antitoxin system